VRSANETFIPQGIVTLCHRIRGGKEAGVSWMSAQAAGNLLHAGERIRLRGGAVTKVQLLPNPIGEGGWRAAKR
jgi:hypothetical protein